MIKNCLSCGKQIFKKSDYCNNLCKIKYLEEFDYSDSINNQLGYIEGKK